jgi:predicted permease
LNLPLTAALGDLGIQIEGRETPEGVRQRRANWQVVTPGYFDAVGMRVVRGRAIAQEDRREAPGVVVVNEAAVRLHWPDRDPVGTRLKLGRTATTWLTVIGVVNDVRQASLRDGPEPEIYLAHAQTELFGGPMRSLAVVIRSTNDARTVARDVRDAVRALDPLIPVRAVTTMREVRQASTSMSTFVWLLLTAFAAVGLVVAALGVYAVMAYWVAERRRELGVRMALGATTGRVVLLVLQQGAAAAGIGIVLGVAGGLALGRFLGALLYQVSPADPLAIASACALATVAALLASYIPAHRAARADPIAALRAS